jgi:L-glyceraldehyde 3-phosphate reductase
MQYRRVGKWGLKLPNNYGPPYGPAEETFGQILRKDLAGHRDEILVSTKASWDMWPGPYGDGAAPPRVPGRSCPA